MITSHSTIENYNNKSNMDDMRDESPLDVLSRAATMIQQENEQQQLQQANLTDDSNKQNKQTMKWKRDRKRPPEYSRKSDPKIPETLGVEPSSPEASISHRINPLTNLNGVQQKKDICQNHSDAPLDMSIDKSLSNSNSKTSDTSKQQQRGLPPSYAQTINSPNYRSNCKTIFSYNGAPPTLSNVRDQFPTGFSMCDSDIDEHFRRSLGNDYHTLCQKNGSTQPLSNKSPVKTSASDMVDFMVDPDLSVEDHFARALGDTWKKLKEKPGKEKKFEVC